MPEFRRILGIAILVCCLAEQAVAGSVQSFKGGVQYYGDIESGDFAKVRTAIQRSAKKTLYLNSAGGLVDEALKIGAFVRAVGVETRLGRQATCASACVLVFAGGVIRSADETARIIVHMGSGIFNEEALAKFESIHGDFGAVGSAVLASYFEQQAALMTLAQVHFLLKSGISIRFLEIASGVHHMDGRQLSRSEAIELNLINAN